MMKTRFATSPDGTRIAYEMDGAGPALMLLHGGGGCRQDWQEPDYVARLRSEFTVISVDLRGHGESDHPIHPVCYTTDRLGEDLLSVADACGFEHFSIWGYSWGGNISRYLASGSERVSRLIMIGSRLGTGVSDEFRQFVFDLRARWAPVVQASAGMPFDPHTLSQPDREEIEQLSFPGELLPVVLAWSSAMLDWGTVTPADLHCPTLWLIGSENTGAIQNYEAFKASLPGSKVQVHILQGLDHGHEATEIEQALPIMLAFMRS